jgi:hypothetical protein
LNWATNKPAERDCCLQAMAANILAAKLSFVLLCSSAVTKWAVQKQLNWVCFQLSKGRGAVIVQ